MTEHDKSEPAGNRSEAKPRKIGTLGCTTAEVLIHRRLLAHLIATLAPALFGQDKVEQAKRDLHALVVADIERARFLGSSPEDADEMRAHANAVLDAILIGVQPHPVPDDER